MKAKVKEGALDASDNADLYDQIQEFLDEETAITKGLHEVMKFLHDLEDDDEVPDDVSVAAKKVGAYLGKQGADKGAFIEDETSKSEESDDEGAEEGANKSDDESRLSLKKKIARVIAKLITTPETVEETPAVTNRFVKAEELFPGLMENINKVNATDHTVAAKKQVNGELFTAFKDAVLAEEDDNDN